jgi:hypothetical protein
VAKPTNVGLYAGTRTELLAAWLTICVNIGDVLPWKVVFPEYCAVMEWLPTASAVVE